MKKNPDIKRPTLLLNTERALKNIAWMAEKASNDNVRFRPHFKTHQSALIGKWFKKYGVEAITVSSVEMADYFAENGWKDITIAFPVNIREIDKINQLTTKICLNLLVESLETVGFLEKNVKSKTDVWIKVDVGYRRTGVMWDQHKKLKELAEAIKKSKKLSLTGLLTHAGHTYHAGSPDEIRQIFNETRQRMQATADLLSRFSHDNVQISIGDTPGCTLATNFQGVDEVRPGNFVFYDVMQMNLGVCREEQIAVGVACPVVAIHPERGEIVIHGGAVHFSKEFIIDEKGKNVFGYIAELSDSGWSPIVKNTFLSSLSQEHGIIKTDASFIARVKVSDVLVVLPIHSCLTVNLMRKYLTTDGKEIKTMFCE